MLSTKNLSKRYGSLEILKGVSLDVEKAEIVSIVGASGAGKSTLLHILGTLERPDSGTLHISGTDVFSLSATKLADFRNKNIGFIFQFHHLLPEFSALENVCMPSLIAGVSKKEAVIKASKLLEMLHLADRVHHKPAELSGGEQQRVAIARALINSPAIVLADEPTGNLDPEASWEIMQILSKINQQNTTVVVATHDKHIVDMMRKRVIALHGGNIIRDQQLGRYHDEP